MFTRKSGASLALASCALFMIAACSGGKQGNEAVQAPKDQSDSVVEKPAATGPQELTISSAASGPDEKTFNEMYGNSIRKKFPDLKLTYIQNTKGSTMPDMIAAKTKIDIVFDSIAFSAAFRDYGIHVDMTPFLTARKMDLGKFEPTTIEFQKRVGNGAVYSLPVWTATAGLFYNKDLFDKFGVEYPKDGLTWSELLDLAKRLTRNEGGVQYVGYVTSIAAQANTNQLGLKYIDAKTGKAQIDHADWTGLMQSLIPFFQIPGMKWTTENTTVAAMRAMFEKDRTAAMYTNFSGGTPPEDMNWDVVQVPSHEKAPGIGPQSYPAYISLTSLSQNKELAMDVIQYLVSEEFQLENTRGGRATTLNNKDILSNYGQGLAKFKGKNITAMFPAKRAPIGDYSEESNAAATAFSNAFVKIITNQADVNTALREANEITNQKIEELKQKKGK